VTRSCRVLLVMGVVSAAFVFPAFPYPAGNTAGPCHYGTVGSELSPTAVAMGTVLLWRAILVRELATA
jgi:hypothetical protein